jgi:phage-related holin
MKSTTTLIFLPSMILGFICSYFLELTMQNAEQYLAVATLVFADGFFGIIAGVKREGFKTYKAIKILKTLIFWVLILTLILVIEKSIPGAGWLSETMLMPLVIFQLISVIKNASMSGFIKADVLNKILDRIDRHKGLRE